MAIITYYVAFPIVRDSEGELCPGEPIEALNEWQARSRATGLAIHNHGAVAFSRTGGPSSGDFQPAVVLSCHGELPSELKVFMGGSGEQ
jgi:hypothetical protein